MIDNKQYCKSLEYRSFLVEHLKFVKMEMTWNNI